MNASFPPDKLPVALELDKSLVEAAEKLGPSLSATVEKLLAAHVRQELARQEAAAHAAFTNAFIERCGDWAEEYRTL